MVKKIVVLLVIALLPLNFAFTGQTQTNWSVSTTGLSSAGGFLVMGYYFTSNGNSNAGSFCYLMGGLLLAAGISEKLKKKNSIGFYLKPNNNCIGFFTIQHF